MAQFIDMHVDQVYRAGVNVSDLSGEADAQAQEVVSVLSEAEGVVQHPVLTGAFSRYFDAWSTPAYRAPRDIDALGARIRGAASAIAQGDADAKAAAEAIAAQSAQLATDTRNILAGQHGTPRQ